MKKSNCVFCKIIEGGIPSEKLWEDKKYFVMLDSNPVKPGHTLVIPKKHTDYIFDLSDKDYTELMLKSKTVAKKLKTKLKPKRVGIIVEGFGVSHVHVHLVPLSAGNQLNLAGAKSANSNKLRKIAQRILK